MCFTNQNFSLLVTKSIKIIGNAQVHFLSMVGCHPVLFCFVSSSSAEIIVCLGIF